MSAEVKPSKPTDLHPRIVRALRQLGADISHARRTRRIAAEDFAQRIGISRTTLHRLENGDPGIALATLALALHAIGRLDALATIADPSNDHVTMMEMREQAPKRIGRPRMAQSTYEDDEMPEEPSPPATPQGKFRGF